MHDLSVTKHDLIHNPCEELYAWVSILIAEIRPATFKHDIGPHVSMQSFYDPLDAIFVTLRIAIQISRLFQLDQLKLVVQTPIYH